MLLITPDCASSRLPPPTTTPFTTVQGMACPNGGLGCDYRTRGGCDLVLYGGKVREAISTIVLRDRARYLTTPAHYRRNLAAYERELRFPAGTIQRILEVYAKQKGVQKVTIIDMGCGDGLALEDLFSFSFVDKNNSYGVTLDTINADQEVLKQILRANALNLTVKEKKFDVLFSIKGVIFYYPYNDSGSEENVGMAGLLFSLKFVKVGGIVITSDIPMGLDNTVLQKLVKTGILSLFGQEDTPNNVTLSNTPPLARNMGKVFQVVRHPTLEDISHLLPEREATSDQNLPTALGASPPPLHTDARRLAGV